MHPGRPAAPAARPLSRGLCLNLMTAIALISRTLADAPPLCAPVLRAIHMGMAAPVYYTAEMVRNLPDDGNRYETVYGELLVTPAPRLWYQEVGASVAHTLRSSRG